MRHTTDHWKKSSSFRGTATDDDDDVMFYTSLSSCVGVCVCACVLVCICACVNTHVFIVALSNSLDGKLMLYRYNSHNV